VLTSLVSTLPAKWQPYAKTYAAALVTGLAVVASFTPLPDWLAVVLAVLTAPVVFAVPNLDPNARKQSESVQPPPRVQDVVDAALNQPIRDEGI
jgi:hypothetical protein